jgi:GNAT superfamily N-acetyltransferase
MRIDVRPIDAGDDGQVEAAFRVEAAARADGKPDVPPLTFNDFARRLRHDWPGNRSHHWLARAGGQPVGVLSVDLPYLDNTTMAAVHLVVHPDRRREGTGTLLHTTAVEFARTNGRTLLQGEYVDSLPGGPERSPAAAAFAVAVGAKVGLNEVRRRLDLSTVDSGPWAGMLADARTRASGYSVVAWTDAAPADIVSDVDRLEGRLLIDAPTGDMIYEAERIDAHRFRATEEALRQRGRRAYHVGARHDRSGRLVAWTMITFDGGSATHAFQQITIVDPDHRGHRLGQLVKLENLSHTRAAEPALVHIDSYNAADNTHMIAINEAIGFRPVDAFVLWQQHI